MRSDTPKLFRPFNITLSDQPPLCDRNTAVKKNENIEIDLFIISLQLYLLCNYIKSDTSTYVYFPFPNKSVNLSSFSFTFGCCD